MTGARTKDRGPRDRLPVVYIAGVGRSGSTLLERMLTRAPGVVGVGELGHLWARGLAGNERCGCGEAFRSCAFWCRVGDFAFGGWDAQEVESLGALQRRVDRTRFVPLMVAPLLWPPYRRRLRQYADTLGQLYRAIASASGASVVVDSTKHASMGFLLRHVPGIDPRVVHIVRDARAVAYSWTKSVPKPEVDGHALMHRMRPPETAHRWLIHNLLLHLLGRLGVASTFLRYEHLVAAPATQLARLLRFAGVDAGATEPALARDGEIELEVSHSVSGNPMRFRRGRVPVRRDDEWRERLARRHRLLVTLLTWPLLRCYGYLRSSPEPPAAPVPQVWPPVSVVVPTRDRPALLRRALDAILEQDYPGTLEVLVVFDQAAPDRTLQRSDPRRVQVLENARRPGLAGARNTGIAAARGDLIAFCDDDDVWRPGKLLRQVAALAAAPDAGAATGAIVVRYRRRAVTRTPRGDALTYQGLLRDRVAAAHPSTYLFRARVLAEIGPVDEELPGSYAEDHDLLLRAARHSRVLSVPQPLADVYWGEASFFADRWRTILDALDYLAAKHPDVAAEPCGLARLYGRKAFAHAALGEPAAARHWALQSLRQDWRDRRAYAALAVSSGLIGAGTATRLAHALGRGI